MKRGAGLGSHSSSSPSTSTPSSASASPSLAPFPRRFANSHLTKQNVNPFLLQPRQATPNAKLNAKPRTTLSSSSSSSNIYPAISPWAYSTVLSRTKPTSSSSSFAKKPTNLTPSSTPKATTTTTGYRYRRGGTGASPRVSPTPTRTPSRSSPRASPRRALVPTLSEATIATCARFLQGPGPKSNSRLAKRFSAGSSPDPAGCRRTAQLQSVKDYSTALDTLVQFNTAVTEQRERCRKRRRIVEEVGYESLLAMDSLQSAPINRLGKPYQRRVLGNKVPVGTKLSAPSSVKSVGITSDASLKTRACTQPSASTGRVTCKSPKPSHVKKPAGATPLKTTSIETLPKIPKGSKVTIKNSVDLVIRGDTRLVGSQGIVLFVPESDNEDLYGVMFPTSRVAYPIPYSSLDLTSRKKSPVTAASMAMKQMDLASRLQEARKKYITTGSTIVPPTGGRNSATPMGL